MKPIRIPALAPERLAELEEMYRTTRDARLRTRAQMVLLAAERRMTAVEIAEIVRASEETVRRRPRSLGLPFSVWTLRRLADHMAEQTGIRVEYETVRVHLKASGIVLSRPQHTISSPDPEYALKKRRSKRHATTSEKEITSTTPTSSI